MDEYENDVRMQSLLHPSVQKGTYEWAEQRLMEGYWVAHIRDNRYLEFMEPIGDDDYYHVCPIIGDFFSVRRRRMTPLEVKDEMQKYDKWRDGWILSFTPPYTALERK